MSLKPLALFLRNIVLAKPLAAQAEMEARQVIKELGIPPALFSVRVRKKELYLQVAQAQVRSEIFVHQKNILERLKSRLGDRAPTTLRF